MSNVVELQHSLMATDKDEAQEGVDLVQQMERIVAEMAVQRAEVGRFQRTMGELRDQMSALADNFDAYGQALDRIPHRALRRQALKLAATVTVKKAR
jgi:molybdenum-dependent DNA-binding transcriptional regulator ModE